MEQKRQPYLSVGIDIGADFSLMAIALPIQEIIGKPYKILHSSNRSVQGAVERILLLPNENIGNLVVQKEGGDPIRRML